MGSLHSALNGLMELGQRLLLHPLTGLLGRVSDGTVCRLEQWAERKESLCTACAVATVNCQMCLKAITSFMGHGFGLKSETVNGDGVQGCVLLVVRHLVFPFFLQVL